jgi:ATP-dependent protease ClpP protease subunit
LISLCHKLHSQGESSIRINISSPGGCIKSAIHAHNVLASIPMVIHTHNFGDLESSSLVILLAGNVKSASPNSRFTFQIPKMIIKKDSELNVTQVKRLLIQMEGDLERMISILRSCTNFVDSNVDWEGLLNSQIILDASSALAYGFIDIIGEESIRQEINNIIVI